MTNTYRSIIDITGSDDVTEARSLALNGVQSLAAEAGIFLSQDQVVERTSLGTYEKDGKTYLQALLTAGD